MKRKTLSIIVIAMALVMALPVISAIAASYIGNTNSYKFHYASCRAAKKMKASNRIAFSSREEAVSYGMTPCGICRP